jgi:VWFA-related protein
MPYTRPFAGRFIAPLAAVALLSAPLATAQDPPAQTLRVDVNLVMFDTTMKDKAGRVLDDLKREDVRLEVDGRPQEIAHFSRDQLPLAMALVVQRNGWMAPFAQPLRYATLSVLKVLKPEDQVALFTFDDDIERRVDLTSDKAKVAGALDFGSKGMGTNINTAVYEAARYLRDQAPAARRVILLVSDNVPAECKPGVEHEKVLQTAIEADTPVYSLKLPYRGPLLSLTGMAEHWLVNVNKLTHETSGEVVEVEKEGSIYLAFKTILERLKTRYTVGFYPSTQLDGRFHKLDVQLQPSFGKRGKDYTVLCKTGFYAARAKVALR